MTIERMEVQVQKALFVQQLPPHLRVQFGIHATGLCSGTSCCPFGGHHSHQNAEKGSDMAEKQPETPENVDRELDNAEDPIEGIAGDVKRPGSGAGDLEKALTKEDDRPFLRKAGGE